MMIGERDPEGRAEFKSMTLEEIAKLAKVSKSTVSLVLNERAGIGKDTRERVLRIMDQVGYTRNRATKNGKNSRAFRFLAHLKGDIVSDNYQNTPFFSELIHDIEEECSKHDFNIIFTTARGGSVGDKPTPYWDRDVASGTILLGDNVTKEEIRALAERDPRLVVINTSFETLNVEFVLMNNVKGAYDACKYLVSLGHKTIGYAQGIVRIYNFESRKRGFMLALQESGLQLRSEDIFVVHSEFGASNQQFIDILSKRKKDLPSAVFCENDYIAIGLIKALTEARLGVPKDVSVVGFDDISHCRIISPELSTVHVEKKEIASLAVRRLITIVKDTSVPRRKTVLDTSLVVRKSCSAYRPRK